MRLSNPLPFKQPTMNGGYYLKPPENPHQYSMQH